MAAEHEKRYLVLAVTADESADTFVVTSATYYRDASKLADSDGFTPASTLSAASATAAEVEFGEAIPAPTIIRLVATFQA